MDAGIIAAFKQGYKRKHMHWAYQKVKDIDKPQLKEEKQTKESGKLTRLTSCKLCNGAERSGTSYKTPVRSITALPTQVLSLEA